MLSKPEFRNYHEREAARLRSLLETATTPALRTRLVGASQGARGAAFAEELEDLKAAAAEA